MKFKLQARELQSLCERVRKFANSKWLDVVAITIIAVLATVVFMPTGYQTEKGEEQADLQLDAEPPSPILDEITIQHQEANNADMIRQHEAEIAEQNKPENIIKRIFADDYVVAIAVAKAESGLNATIMNGKCTGIFQVNALPGRPSIAELKNPETNITYSRTLYDACKKKTGNGWVCDWEAYNNGSYKRFLAK